MFRFSEKWLSAFRQGCHTSKYCNYNFKKSLVEGSVFNRGFYRYCTLAKEHFYISGIDSILYPQSPRLCSVISIYPQIQPPIPPTSCSKVSSRTQPFRKLRLPYHTPTKSKHNEASQGIHKRHSPAISMTPPNSINKRNTIAVYLQAMHPIESKAQQISEKLQVLGPEPIRRLQVMYQFAQCQRW